MDQKKIGNFLKILRKERGITQAQLAEILMVSSRTVSRWETGSNMPDLAILIQLADYYEVELRELLDGERRSEKMNKDLEETVIKVADYSNEEKDQQIKALHFLFLIGALSFLLYTVLEFLGLADNGLTETIASFALGLSFGILIIGVIVTSRYRMKIQKFKAKLRKRH